MKVTAPAKAFAQAFSAGAALALGSNKKLPAAAGYKAIQIIADELSVIARADVGHMSLTHSIDATITEPGRIAADGERLANLVANLSADKPVSLADDGNVLTVACGAARYRLPIIVGELPAMLQLDGEVGRVELESATAYRCLTIPMAAISDDQIARTRPHLAGIHIRHADHELRAVATDGRALIEVIVPDVEGPEGARTIPLATALLACKLIKAANPASRTVMRFSPTMISVGVPGVVLTSTLIAGEYPDYGRIIPAASANAVVVNRLDLLQALARVAAVIGQRDRPVTELQWAAGEILHLGAAGHGDLADDPIAAESTGAGRVTINAAMLSDLLSAIGGERVRLDMGGELLRVTTEPDMNVIAMLAPMRSPGEGAA